jgi:DNA repair protein RecN (Recombination protein N)
MLQELHIKNFAIIDEVTVAFGQGLNVLTGETGAGKSIVIDAVKVLLGDKVSQEIIRDGHEEAFVEGIFDISMGTSIQETLESAGIAVESELLLKRVISKSGKNRVYINGNIATLSILASIGENLIDIYGQHEHQSLIKPWSHLDILDTYGALWPLRMEMREQYKKLTALQKELQALKSQSETRDKDLELLSYQLAEIEGGHLKIGEEEDLQKERERLKCSEDIVAAVEEGYNTLYTAQSSVLERLAEITEGLKKVSAVDDKLNRYYESLQSIAFQLEDIAFELRDYGKDIDMAPEQLEEIEERLTFLAKLKRKYGKDIEGILEIGEEVKRKIEDISKGDEREKEVEKELNQVERSVRGLAENATARRREFSKGLKEGVEKELSGLGMGKANFEVRIEDKQMSEKGTDGVAFFLSANPGEQVKPLSKIVSGGELSRIMLALKLVGKTVGVPTLIFDEVDSGVGGKVADEVGMRLKRLSLEHQVLCITHLPQIASYGAAHYHVLKEEKEGRTVVKVEGLDEIERIKEVSRMLGGARVTEKTREHAEEMVRNAVKAGNSL